MKAVLLRMAAAALIVGAMINGCSDPASDVNSPQQEAPKAPLLGKGAAAGAIEGSYIVVFKESVKDVDEVVASFAMQHRVSADHRYRNAIKGFAGRLSPAVLDELRRDDRVAYIEHDQIAHIVAVQSNLPSWGLDRIDQRALPLSLSYTYNETGAGVDAYIIDTGIRTTHTDFGGRAVPGYDAVTIGGTANDGNGHGTHVAGTVGGTTFGVAKSVRLIAVRVLNNNGSGTYAQVIAGVDWVTGDHTTTPAVANMSLGGPTSTALDDAVRNSIADGITYSIAAGNSTVNASTQSPARVTEAITVGATSSTDAFASFSNYGSVVDLSAPGVSITSAWYTSNTATNTISGTSMAAPHVAGAAALYLQLNPAASPASVATALIANATNNVITNLPSGTPNRLLFTTEGATPPPAPPAAPTLVSPANGATNVPRTATLVWNASTGATSYRVQVSTSSSFGTTVFDQSGVTATSVTVAGLGSRVRYYWRVNATNNNGTSSWSATRNFRTAR